MRGSFPIIYSAFFQRSPDSLCREALKTERLTLERKIKLRASRPVSQLKLTFDVIDARHDVAGGSPTKLVPSATTPPQKPTTWSDESQRGSQLLTKSEVNVRAGRCGDALVTAAVTVLEETTYRNATAGAPPLPTCLKSEKCGGHSWFHTNTMPPDRYSPQDAFDATLFDARALDAPDGLNTALHAIEAACYRGDIAEMVATLNSRAYILEYMISGTLRVTVDPCASLSLIILLSSAGGRSIREALEVDRHGLSHIPNAKHDGRHEYATPPAVLIFIAIRRISVHRRCTPQPPHVLEKDATLVRYPKSS